MEAFPRSTFRQEVQGVDEVEDPDCDYHHQPVQDILKDLGLHDLAVPPLAELNGSVDSSNDNGDGRDEASAQHDPPFGEVLLCLNLFALFSDKSRPGLGGGRVCRGLRCHGNLLVRCSLCRFFFSSSYLPFSESVRSSRTGSKGEVETQNDEYAHGDELKNDSRDHYVCSRGCWCRVGCRRSGLASSDRLEDQRDDVGGYEDDKVPAGTENRILGTESLDRNAEDEVVVRGEEDWRHDQRTDLHEEWSDVKDIAVGPKPCRPSHDLDERAEYKGRIDDPIFRLVGLDRMDHWWNQLRFDL